MHAAYLSGRGHGRVVGGPGGLGPGLLGVLGPVHPHGRVLRRAWGRGSGRPVGVAVAHFLDKRLFEVGVAVGAELLHERLLEVVAVGPRTVEEVGHGGRRVRVGGRGGLWGVR